MAETDGRVGAATVTRRGALAWALLAPTAARGVEAPAVLRRDLAFDRDVAVIGAGAAGLAAAAECARLGRSCMIVEARGRVGGRIVTDDSLGAPFDAGALFLHWAERNPWRELASGLGATLVDEPASGFRVVGRREGEAAVDGETRRLQFRRLARMLDGPSVEDISVEELARRAGLGEAASGLTRMALGEEPGRVSARDYAQLWSGDDLVAPQGFGRLATAFARGLDVRTGCAAIGLRWDGPGVEVETTQGALRAAAAIVTLPVGVLKAGGVAFRPALPNATLGALDGLEMGALSKIALSFDRAGLGVGEPTDIILRDGDTLIDFDCWAFGRPLVVGYVGGDAARALTGLGEEGAIAAALDGFVAAAGGDVRGRFKGGRLYGWVDDPFALGSYSHALPGRASARAALATPLGERVFFAGEATGGEGGDFGGAMTAGGAFLAGRAAARGGGVDQALTTARDMLDQRRRARDPSGGRIPSRPTEGSDMELRQERRNEAMLAAESGASTRFRASGEAVDRAARAIVFDSGLGGVTVLREIRALRPDVDMLYAADDAGFPYGAWSEPALVERVLAVMERLIGDRPPDAVVIACNTASTLVLAPLRARWPGLPFVGTVPAVKPAAAASTSKLISVLATPGTVSRDYTRKLVDDFAAGCEVTLVGSTRLAGLAEAAMRGRAADDSDILAEILPCFVEKDGRRTDAVALACTHYPLLLDAFRRLAPWPVAWIDPAPAIARRVDWVLAEQGFGRRAGLGSAAYAFTSRRAVEPDLGRWLGALALEAAPDRERYALPASSGALT